MNQRDDTAGNEPRERGRESSGRRDFYPGSHGFDTNERIYEGQGSSGSERAAQMQSPQGQYERDGYAQGQQRTAGGRDPEPWHGGFERQSDQHRREQRGYGGAAEEPGGGQGRYAESRYSYQRSDERLKEDISERLMEAYHIDSSEVTVEVRGAKVTLEGTVPSRHMKHAIEDLVDGCPGVLDIDNRVRVGNQTAAGGGTVSTVSSGTTGTTAGSTGPSTASTSSPNGTRSR
ncbi:MAG: BON domain-containing protein [Steroidobacteraceae bacterium]